ncbi:hypothetical protein PFICI_03955 [Pestalotiopsis fici W106-1]|uniref:Uncharacterized protein n=1 Tax=Pestalotiopsis fici (strain W106-1 / CGMCC3.15140) TaxID=1229662 RepID=W3XIT5_PESFW|nr:uncharacterized protein PFICI_03955 [Pestalotiopsis fici W106-1]ETS85930.1 hypothetical protein PFICI_03955 [Pestalotiopsis fici W106-1]
MATPSTLEPIPVLLCGKFPSHTKATSEILQPEFKVIKICTNPSEAATAVKALFSSSGSSNGNNNSNSKPILDGIEYDRPRVVIMGGGYSHADFAAIHNVVDGARSVPWVRPLGTKPDGPERLPAQPPSAGEIAGRVRRVLDEHLGELREGGGAGQIWWM